MKALLVAVLVCWSILAFGQTAGKVDLVDGEVQIIDVAKNARTPKLGDVLSVGDSVVTGADGELHLAMEDGGQMAVRPNTRMTVDKYKAEGGTDDRSVISLMQGALRSVTGWIGKFQPKNYQIRTPTATIGVRGTDHETRVIPPDSKEGEAGTYDKVNAGSTLLRTQHGTTEVHPNQAGFASFTGKKRPAVLAAVPGFFRPTKHEGRFADLHEKVHKELGQRRDERIKKVKETRAQFDNAKNERKLDRNSEKTQQRTQQREQRLQQKEERRKAGEAGVSMERRHQFQEKRLQREAASRHEGSDASLSKTKRSNFSSTEPRAGVRESRQSQADRRHQPTTEHKHEFGRSGEGGGGHRRH
jgi:hypothetical protein